MSFVVIELDDNFSVDSHCPACASEAGYDVEYYCDGAGSAFLEANCLNCLWSTFLPASNFDPLEKDPRIPVDSNDKARGKDDHLRNIPRDW